MRTPRVAMTPIVDFSQEPLRAGAVRETGRRGLEGDVAHQLRDAILKGTFPPGARIVELELAARWGVSQGTIRAALRTLRHEDLVEYRPRRGNFVRRMSSADVIEIYSLRDALEALGARLAAERISPDRCRVLERVLQAMRSAATAGNRKRAMELDFEVHRTIIAMSGHRRLAEAYTSLETQTRLFMAMTGRFHHDLSELVSIHEPLVAAICAGKAQRAFDLAIRHNEPDGRKLAQSVADGFPAGLRGAGGRQAFPR